MELFFYLVAVCLLSSFPFAHLEMSDEGSGDEELLPTMVPEPTSSVELLKPISSMLEESIMPEPTPIVMVLESTAMMLSSIMPELTLSVAMVPQLASQSSVAGSGLEPTLSAEMTPVPTSSFGVTPVPTSSFGVTPVPTSSFGMTPEPTSSFGMTPVPTSSFGMMPEPTSSVEKPGPTSTPLPVTTPPPSRGPFVLSPDERPEIVPGTSEDTPTSSNSFIVSFTLIPEQGEVDIVRIFVQQQPSTNTTITTYYVSNKATRNFPQYAALDVRPGGNNRQRRKRQEDNNNMQIEVQIGNSNEMCGPIDDPCNGPLDRGAEFKMRYQLISGNTSADYDFFDTSFSTAPADEQDDTSLIVGVFFALLIFLVMVILVALVVAHRCYRKRKTYQFPVERKRDSVELNVTIATTNLYTLTNPEAAPEKGTDSEHSEISIKETSVKETVGGEKDAKESGSDEEPGDDKVMVEQDSNTGHENIAGDTDDGNEANVLITLN